MDVYIPYRPSDPKTRLSPALSPSERRELSREMLMDVYQTVSDTGHTPIVLATESLRLDVRTTVSTAPLSEAVNSTLPPAGGHRAKAGNDTSRPVGVVMADLGLVTVDGLEQLFEPDSALTIAPGQRGGTNAFVTRSSDFRVDYHGASLRDHREIADTNGVTLTEVDSFRLACDIDEPSDLVDLFLHGEGRAGRYLRARSEIDRTNGTVTV
jgi:2-phospho-L-lactate guanylyltransferase